MNTKRKCQVVMLPTNGKALINNQLYLSMDSNPMKLGLTSRAFTSGENFNKIPQHLYITSDEEIKEGEYGIDIRDNKIFKCERLLSNHYECGILQYQKSYCHKIIATTDNLRLICKDEFGGIDNQFFPQPPQQFIEDYIKEYNKGNVITEVEVEYEEIINPIWESYFEFTDYCMKNGYNEQWYSKEKLKVNPDNTINIKPTKDSWSREEVKQLLNKFSIDCFKIAKESVIWGEDCPQIVSDKWIEQNM